MHILIMYSAAGHVNVGVQPRNCAMNGAYSNKINTKVLRTLTVAINIFKTHQGLAVIVLVNWPALFHKSTCFIYPSMYCRFFVLACYSDQ